MEGIKVFRILNGNSQQVDEGTLEIQCIQSQNVYYLTVHHFYYTLQKQTKFGIINFETQRTIVFPHLEEGFNAIIIPLAYEQNQALDVTLNTTVTLLQPDQVKADQVFKQALDQHCPEIWTKPLVEDSQVIHYIQKGGGILKTGLSFLGGVMAAGVSKGGEWIDSKIDKNENPAEVSQSTKTKLDTVKETTKTGFQMAGGFFNKVFTPVAQYTNQVIDNVSNQIDQGDNQTLKKVKEITKVTSHSINTAVEGLVDGAGQVGGALKDTSEQIVNKKYGEDYSKTFLGADGQQQQQQQPAQQVQQQQQQQNVTDESQQELLGNNSSNNQSLY